MMAWRAAICTSDRIQFQQKIGMTFRCFFFGQCLADRRGQFQQADGVGDGNPTFANTASDFIMDKLNSSLSWRMPPQFPVGSGGTLNVLNQRSSKRCCSVTWRTRTGTDSRPASLAARSRRSPATSTYCPACGS